MGVTMFFNLKPLSDTTENTRGNDFYEQNSIATLSVDIPLVILCDAASRAWIEPLRNTLSSAETHYIEKNITEYDHYRLNHPIVVNNRKISPGYNNPDNRNTPSYLLTTTFKFYALQMASETVKDATHYVWIDFGCQHIVWEAKERLQQIFNNPRSKITMTYIHYRSSAEIRDMTSYLANGGPCSLAGTVFSVEKSYMNLLFTRFQSLFYEQLSKGVGHNEEQVLMYLYDRYPEMFNIVYGDYYSVVSNYHHPVRDYHTIRGCFIEPALNAGRRDLAAAAAQAIVTSYINGNIDIDKTQIEYLRGIIQ